MYKLSANIRAAIKTNKQIQGMLMDELDISWNTLYRWLRTNDINLTTYHSLKIISEQLGTVPNELITYYPKKYA